MLNKKRYAVQPYHVGCKGKDRQSLAIVVPSKVARTLQIDNSTIFILDVDEIKKIIHLQMLQNEKLI